MSHFASYSILHGLKPHEFNSLPKATKKKIIKLIARISEKSYRRGVHHAFAVGFAHQNVSDWRYKNLSKSQGIDTACTFSVEDRLIQQNSELYQIGLI